MTVPARSTTGPLTTRALFHETRALSNQTRALSTTRRERGALPPAIGGGGSYGGGIGGGGGGGTGEFSHGGFHDAGAVPAVVASVLGTHALASCAML